MEHIPKRTVIFFASSLVWNSEAEGLGVETLSIVGPTARRFAQALNKRSDLRPLGHTSQRFPRPSAWAKQIPGPSGRFECGCATSKRASEWIIGLCCVPADDPLACASSWYVREYLLSKIRYGVARWEGEVIALPVDFIWYTAHKLSSFCGPHCSTSTRSMR